MERNEFSFKTPDNQTIYYLNWPANDQPKACVQIAHGMAEHIERYDDFAQHLVKAGYAVYGNDHRGHGKTAGSLDNVGYFADQNGFDLVVQDMNQLTDIIKETYPKAPIILFGHSMGSLLSRQYLLQYGSGLKGVILSGTMGSAGMLGHIAIYLAKRECRKKGPKTPSPLMTKMAFGAYNKAFSPARTDFDWLSKDNGQVDKYVADPFCGAEFSGGYWVDFLMGLKETVAMENSANIPKELPVLFIAGDKDPVGNNGKAVTQMSQVYQNAGVEDVQLKLYPDGRHEMLNEVNKSEVYADIIQWLEKHS